MSDAAWTDAPQAPDILPDCQAHNTGVIVYSPMAAGSLTGAMTHLRAAALHDNNWQRDDGGASDGFVRPTVTA